MLIFVLVPRSKSLHAWTLLMLHLHVESIGCSTFVGYSCMHLRLYLLPFRLSKVQWVHRHSQIPLDLLWVRQVIPGLAHLPCPRVQLSDWSDYILLHDEWLGIVRRAADLHRGLVCNQVETRAWLRRFHCKLERVGLWRHLIPQAVLQETFCCPQCVEVFSSYQQMAAHRAARHCFRNLASFYAGGTCCMACAREFHHSKALFDHLNYVRTGCLCTWACLSLPCAMPVAVRHAGRGADSLLISSSGFVVPPMSICAPLLPAGDLKKPCR